MTRKNKKIKPESRDYFLYNSLEDEQEVEQSLNIPREQSQKYSELSSFSYYSDYNLDN